eukprot:6183562-Pleurochrysis_carterae.AAC.1
MRAATSLDGTTEKVSCRTQWRQREGAKLGAGRRLAVISLTMSRREEVRGLNARNKGKGVN